MSIYAVGTIFVQMTLGMNMFITAQGFSKTSMLTVTIGAVCNIILDPIFIFGFGMGVKGAALATIISQAVSCGWVLAFLTGKKTFLRIKKEYLKPVPSIVFPCLALGLSTFVMQSSESVISVCFNSSLLKYGGDLGSRCHDDPYKYDAVCNAAASGNRTGRTADHELQLRSEKYRPYEEDIQAPSRDLPDLFHVVLALCPAFPGNLRGNLQLRSRTRFLHCRRSRIYCGAMFLFGIQLACQMTFVAIGYAVCSIIVAVVRKFVLLLPLIFIVPMFVSNKTMGVYMAEPIADAIAVTFTAILFSIQFRKALRKLEKA